MSFDRTEAAGFGVAVAGHAALFAALALGLTAVQETPPMPPAMEVSFAEDVGVQTSGATTEPTAQSFAPEAGPPEEAAPAPQPEPAPPQPLPEPVARQAEPAPQQRPTPPQPQRAAPAPAQRQAQAAPAPTRGTGNARTNRGSALGSEILKGIGDDPVSRNPRASGVVVSNEARASMDAAILRALLPCQRQVLPAPEARAIRVRVEVTLNRNGSLANARVMSVANNDPDLRIYEQRMRDLAVNVVEQCAPIRGLPSEYYNVPRGWRQFRYVFPNS